MEGSFLSRPEVVAASRDWICVRPATYESATEGKILQGFFGGRKGVLENTVFALLDPSGKRTLTRAGRSPEFAFESAAEMVERMSQLSREYPGTDSVPDRGLPKVPDLRLALNIAACDGLPVVVVIVAPDEKEKGAPKPENSRASAASDAGEGRQALAEITRAAWSSLLIGRAHYVVLSNAKALTNMERFDSRADVFVLSPDEFGVDASILGALESGTASFVDRLTIVVLAHDVKAPDSMEHVRRGQRAGIHWDSVLPVTDSSSSKSRR